MGVRFKLRPAPTAMFAKIFALFVTVALIELSLFVLVGARIGLWPTLGIILLTGMLGAALTKSQGRARCATSARPVRKGACRMRKSWRDS